MKTRSNRKRKPRDHHVRSNAMRRLRCSSSRSSRGSATERQSYARQKRRRNANDYGSSIASTATSRDISRQSHTGHAFSRRGTRHPVESPKPIEGLRLTKRKVLVPSAASLPEPIRLLRGKTSLSSRTNELMGSSSLLVSSTKSNLRRRPRVDKRGSMSEGDPVRCRLPTSFSSFAPSILHEKGSATPATLHSNKGSHRLSSKASPSTRKYTSYTPSNRDKQVPTPVTVHSLPLILPACGEYKCHVEWESDQGVSNQNDEAKDLWKRLEKEYRISSPPDLLRDDTENTWKEVELTARRGRWRVKVEETPTICPEVPIEMAFNGIANSPPLQWRRVDEDFEFTESAMGIEDSPVPVLREVSTSELFPPLSAYRRLSSLLNRRTPSHRMRRVKSRQSPALGLTRSRSRCPRAGKGRFSVHRDIKRVVRSFWEDCDDGWIDKEQKDGAVGALYLTRMISRSRSMRISTSGMEGALSRGLQDTCGRSSMGHEVGLIGLGIGMHSSLTLKSRTVTATADSVIDFYAGT